MSKDEKEKILRTIEKLNDIELNQLAIYAAGMIAARTPMSNLGEKTEAVSARARRLTERRMRVNRGTCATRGKTRDAGRTAAITGPVRKEAVTPSATRRWR